MKRYILVDREPVEEPDLMRWASSGTVGTVVAGAILGDDVIVSTVFTGHERRLFETLVMGGLHDGDERHYSTWADAEDGHQAIVAQVRADAAPEAVEMPGGAS